MTHADLPEGFVWLCIAGGVCGGVFTFLLMNYTRLK